MPTRYGSSPMVSSTRPQRASRTTSSTGASPWCTPTARMPVPIRVAISRISAGSKVAPQDNGTGYAVAPQAVNPARHSSWTSAGMPNRPAATIAR